MRTDNLVDGVGWIRKAVRSSEKCLVTPVFISISLTVITVGHLLRLADEYDLQNLLDL